ncbi:metallopeptidase family protein [Roseibium sp.]|uniref:metallopeptidase family protein n=1 Tax=Roseibium sp. TaxID=1936156 RepID=UPI003A97078D
MEDWVKDGLENARTMKSPDNWHLRQPPGLKVFQQIATDAFDALPDEFRDRCRDLVITVEDWASEEMLDSVGVDDFYGLLGLFEGIGLAQGGGELRTGQGPNRIWLFRRPILDYWAGGEDSLGDIISHVLVHEIGHHFGLSDEDMEGIEAAADL